MTCAFFGHGDCYDMDKDKLRLAIEELISNGVDTFYVGNQGHFDSMVFENLLNLKSNYQHLCISVVLAYMPTKKSEYDPYLGYSIYPEGIELGPPRFAIERRNNWMVNQANYCLCYINHAWGGAYKFVYQAKRKGVKIINLGTEEI